MSICGESNAPATPVKFKLRRAPDGPMRQYTFTTRPDWNTLAGKIGQLFELSDGSVAVTYTDSDQDEITLSSEEELQQYYSSADCGQPIKFSVTVLSTEKVPTVTLSSSNSGSSSNAFRRPPMPEEDEMQWARDNLRMAGLDEETGEKVLHAFDNMMRAMGPRRHHPFGGGWGRRRHGGFGPPGPHHHPDFFGHPGFRHRPPYGPPFYGPPDADYNSQYEQPVATSSSTTTPVPDTSVAENQTSEPAPAATGSELSQSAAAPSSSATPPPSSELSDATPPGTNSTHGPPPFPGAHPEHHPSSPPLGGHGPFGWPGHPHFHHRGFHGPGHGPPPHMPPPPPYPHHHRGPPPPGHGPPFGPGHWYG